MKPPVAQAGQAQAQAQVHGHIISSRRGRGRGRRCTRCAHARAHAAFTNAHVHTHACPKNGRKCPLPVHGAGSARVCLRAHASCTCLQMHVRAHMRSPTHASTGARARTHAYPAHTHARMHAHPHRYLVVAAVVEVLVTDDALRTARNVSPRAAHAHEHACARAHTRTCVAYALDMLRTPTLACASALPLGGPARAWAHAHALPCPAVHALPCPAVHSPGCCRRQQVGRGMAHLVVPIVVVGAVLLPRPLACRRLGRRGCATFRFSAPP